MFTLFFATFLFPFCQHFLQKKFFLFLRVPLGQPGGEVEDDAQLGGLRGLPLGDGPEGPDPAVGTVGGRADAGNLHQDQQDDGGPQREDGHPPQALVVNLGHNIHGRHPRRAEKALAQEVVGGIVIGAGIEGVGIGRREHHDEADACEQQHQHEKRQVHGTPGELFFHGEIALEFTGHRLPAFQGSGGHTG